MSSLSASSSSSSNGTFCVQASVSRKVSHNTGILHIAKSSAVQKNSWPPMTRVRTWRTLLTWSALLTTFSFLRWLKKVGLPLQIYCGSTENDVEWKGTAPGQAWAGPFWCATYCPLPGRHAFRLVTLAPPRNDRHRTSKIDLHSSETFESGKEITCFRKSFKGGAFFCYVLDVLGHHEKKGCLENQVSVV